MESNNYGIKVQKIVDDIQRIAGKSEWENENDDVVELWYDEVCYQIDKESNLVSAFVSFGYLELNLDKADKSFYDDEEVKQGEETGLFESICTIFFKSNSLNYTAHVWDDGCIMCQGEVIRVGFFMEFYSSRLIEEFIGIYNNYKAFIRKSTKVDMIKFILRKVCSKYDIKIKDGNVFKIADGVVEFNERIIRRNNVNEYYKGRKFFLCKVKDENFVTDITPVNIFIEACNIIKPFEEISLYIEERPLFGTYELNIISSHMTLNIPVNLDVEAICCGIEEKMVSENERYFIPFASEKFAENYYRRYAQQFIGDGIHIITEGTTDWKHMKRYWEQYEKENWNIVFHEFEPTESKKENVTKQDMGNDRLMKLCLTYSKMDLDKTLIFVFDRDVESVTRKMSGDKNMYKSWGNGVYSIVLPVPKHREKTPEICIEHYYSDEEIQTSYVCKDGKIRRLYIANEFDIYGRNIEKGLLCLNTKKCAKKDISIIDASDKVISMNEKDTINYALSKYEFAEKAKINRNMPSYEAFKLLFNVIKMVSIVSQLEKKNKSTHRQ